MSSSVPFVIDSIIEAQAHQKPNQHKPSLILYVSSANPHQFQDSAKNRLVVHKQDASYNKITAKSTILLENSDINLTYGKNGKQIVGCDISSKAVTIEVGTDKQAKLKNFEIKLSLQAIDGLIPVLPSTRRYLRRMEKAEILKKNTTKKATQDIITFIKPEKTQKKQSVKVQNYSVLPSNIEPLDSTSNQILQGLLNFVDKQDLLRLLVKRPLKDKANKKAVRMMVVPTDDQDNTTMQVRKKTYERNQIQELLAEYEARQERMRE